MTSNLCSGCGQVDHAGGCDLVEFYFFQRFARKKDRDPPPPSPLIEQHATPVDEATPLVGLVALASISVAKKRSTKSVSKLTPVDSPEMVVRREAIRLARVENLARARGFRKKKAELKEKNCDR